MKTKRTCLISLVGLWLIVVLALPGFIYAGPVSTSSTAASVIITNARTYLAEASATFWSDAQLLVFLNDGTVDLASRSLCTEATENIDLISNTIEYAPTADYIAILAVVYTDASSDKYALKRSNVRTVGEAFQKTDPSYFYDFAGNVGVLPSLSARTTETITVYLVTKPSALTSGQNVTTPAIYDRALTYYIVAQALIADSRLNDAGAMLALYKEEIDRFRGDLSGATKETLDPIR